MDRVKGKTLESDPEVLDIPDSVAEFFDGASSSANQELSFDQFSKVAAVDESRSAVHEKMMSDAHLKAKASINDKNKQARLWMSSLKVFSPLVKALNKKASSGVAFEDQVKTLVSLFESSDKLAARITDRLVDTGFDPYSDGDRWVLKKILQLSSEMVADQWAQSSSLETDNLEVLFGTMISAFKSRGDEEAYTADTDVKDTESYIDHSVKSASKVKNLLQIISDEEPQIPYSPDAAIECSLLSCMQPVMKEISVFSFFLNQNESIQLASEKVIKGAEWLFYKHKSIGMSDSGKLMLLQSCLRHSGQFYAESWNSNARNFFNQISGMSPSEMVDYKNKNVSDGKIIKAIDKDFEVTLGRLAMAATEGMSYMSDALKSSAGLKKKNVTNANKELI